MKTTIFLKAVLTTVCFMFVMGSNLIFAQDLVRFDFHNYVGEGQTEFYRLNADMANLKGEFCFFDSASLPATDKRLGKLSEDVVWSTLFDLNKVPHSCVNVELYKPFGWFNSPPFLYEEADYRFVFIGKVKKEKMEGKLYQFRDYHPKGDNRVYRTIDQVTVSASGTVIKHK